MPRKTNAFCLLVPLLVLGSLTAGIAAGTEAPAIEWQRSLGGSESDIAYTVRQTADSGYIVGGVSDSKDGDVTEHHGSSYYSDAWIVKLTPTGTIDWQRSLGGSTSNENARNIDQTSDGGYIIIGSSSKSTPYPETDFWLVKLTAAGVLEWEKKAGYVTNHWNAYSGEQTDDGGYIVAGTASAINIPSSMLVVKFTPEGNVSWRHHYGGSRGESAESVRQTPDGGYIIGGSSSSNDGNVTGHHGAENTSDFWVVKISSTGDIQWERSLGGTGSENLHSLDLAADGGYIVAGQTTSSDGDVTGYHGNNDFWVVKLTPSGIIEWQRCLGGTLSDYGHGVKQTYEGGYIVAGYSSSSDGDVSNFTGTPNYWVVKLRPDGSIDWQRTLGGPGSDRAYGIDKATDGGYIIAGYSGSNGGNVTGNHGADYWVVKLFPEETAPARDLVLEVRYKNAVLLNEGVDIDIHVTDGSRPVSAAIALLLNGEIVGTGTGPEYQYHTHFPQAGTYTIEATAQNAAQERRYVGSIEVIGTLTPALVLVSDLLCNAYAEVFQAEDLAADKVVKSGADIGEFAIGEVVQGILFGPIRFFSLEIADIFLHDSILDHIAKFAHIYTVTVKNALAWPYEKAFSMGYETKEDAIRSVVRSAIDWVVIVSEDFAGDDYRTALDKKSYGFRAYVLTHPAEFSDLSPREIRFLSNIYVQPVSNVVETFHTVVDIEFMGYHLPTTMPEMAGIHDTIGQFRDLVTGGLFLIALAFGLCVLAVGIFSGPAGWASIVATAFGGVKILFSLITQITMGAMGARFIITLWLLFSLLSVVPQVVYQHEKGVDGILTAVNPVGEVSPFSLSAADTWVHTPATITSTGHVLVLTPDGRITSIIMGSGTYTPGRPGTYRLVSYQHTGGLFSASRSSQFESALPAVTMDASPALEGDLATITLVIENQEEETIDDLSALVAIENSSAGIVFIDGKTISLAAGEQKVFTFTTALPAPDIYTGSAALSYFSADTLAEVHFPIPYGVTDAEDAAILSLDYEPVYPPMTNVTMNITLQGYRPDLAVNVTVPTIGFTVPVILTGERTMILSLPVLLPDSYLMPVIIERNNRAIDSRMVSFSVAADGVGVLTFNASQLLLTTGEPVTLPLALRDLSMAPLSADVRVTVTDPEGKEQQYPVMPAGDGYSVTFTPAVSGTYLVRGHAEKAGYRIIDDGIIVIANGMSRLNMTVNIDEDVIVRAYGNGRPAACNITMKSGEKTVSTFASNGIAAFNVSGRFTIQADRMFYEPAFFEMPAADFLAEPGTGAAPLRVRFTDTSAGHTDEWFWEFGDGTTSTVHHPIHYYDKPGIYRVNLTVAISGIKDTVSREAMIIVYNGLLVPLPGCTGLPTDPDADGIYEDLNGNGRRDFADVVLCFNQMQWIAANEPVEAFDLNRNGRIDFADIVALFNEV